MKFFCCVFVCAISLSFVACGPRKPAYEDINPQATKADLQNRAAQTGQAAQPPADNNSSSPATASAPSAPAQSREFKPPAFMDMTKGEAKDLPNYPGAVRTSIQYGPMDNSDTLSLALYTTDSMDKIADFYDRAVKSNGWTVTGKTRDRELSEWNLKKGERDEAKVEVRKSPQGSGLMIIIARIEKTPPPKP